MFKALVLFTASFLMVCGPGWTQEVKKWPEKFYNPKPQTKDLTLPLPCGGAMTFRPVAVVSKNFMADEEIRLGNSAASYAYAEGTRKVFISGGFSDSENSAKRLFYLGKYEVTVDQYDALRGKCPKKPTLKGRIPKTGMNWLDGVSFSHDYTEWLLKNSPAALPSEDGVKGFLRLPTETEWEYAARGGLVVTVTEFQESLFPHPQGLNAYAWFSGSQSSKGKPRPAGVKQPNPLGFFDMLGNAEELVLEPYRLNRINRFHGQTGGYVVKGGGYLTAKGELRTAYRQEYPHFNEKGGQTIKTVGMRLAISNIVLTSFERLNSLKQQWGALAKSEPSETEDKAAQDPVVKLDDIIKKEENAALKKRLDNLSLVLKENIASRNRQRDKAARSFIRLGAYIAQKIKQDLRIVKRWQGSLKELKGILSKDKLLKIEKSLEKSQQNLYNNLSYYTDNIINISENYSTKIRTVQLGALAVELQEKKLPLILEFSNIFIRHTYDYDKRQEVDRNAILKDLQK
jgi:hypothetical protein